jgi:hypothetical protein
MSAEAISSFPIDDSQRENPKYHEGRRPFPNSKRLKSPMPYWEVLATGKPARAIIICPRCHNEAEINIDPWLNLKREFIGRSCTYCFAASQVPENLRS